MHRRKHNIVPCVQRPLPCSLFLTLSLCSLAHSPALSLNVSPFLSSSEAPGEIMPPVDRQSLQEVFSVLTGRPHHSFGCGCAGEISSFILCAPITRALLHMEANSVLSHGRLPPRLHPRPSCPRYRLNLLVWGNTEAASNPDRDVPVSHLKTRAAKSPPHPRPTMVEETLLNEWLSFNEHENSWKEQATRRALASLHEDFNKWASCGNISISWCHGDIFLQAKEDKVQQWITLTVFMMCLFVCAKAIGYTAYFHALKYSYSCFLLTAFGCLSVSCFPALLRLVHTYTSLQDMFLLKWTSATQC